MKKFFAYLKDGTQVGFTHPVDRNQAIARGMTANPPGTPVVEKPAPPAGEMVAGISPVGAATAATAATAAKTGKKAGNGKTAKAEAATKATSTKIAR